MGVTCLLTVSQCLNVPRRSHRAVSFIYVPAIREGDGDKGEWEGDKEKGKGRKSFSPCSHLQQLVNVAALVVELHSTRRWWIIDTNINLCAATPAASLSTIFSQLWWSIRLINARSPQKSITMIARGWTEMRPMNFQHFNTMRRNIQSNAVWMQCKCRANDSLINKLKTFCVMTSDGLQLSMKERKGERRHINILPMRIIPEETKNTATKINSIWIHNFFGSIKAKSECYPALWFSVF